MKLVGRKADSEFLVNRAEELDRIQRVESQRRERVIVADWRCKPRQARPESRHGGGGAGVSFHKSSPQACAAQRSSPKAMQAEDARAPSAVEIWKRSPKNAPCRL